MKKELLLVLTTEFFLEILKGEKKEEYRSFTEFYLSRLCVLDKVGEITGMREYDTVRFALGYGRDRPEMIVEFKGVHITHDEDEIKEFLTDENCEFEIELGEILETKNCEKFNV